MITPADLDAISRAQDALDEVDNHLSSALDLIEQALRARVSIRIETEVTGEDFSRIAFGKTAGGWRLLVIHGTQEQTLIGAARKTRARALSGGHVERLVLEAAHHIRSEVDGRKAATDAANHLLQSLATQQGD